MMKSSGSNVADCHQCKCGGRQRPAGNCKARPFNDLTEVVSTRYILKHTTYKHTDRQTHMTHTQTHHLQTHTQTHTHDTYSNTPPTNTYRHTWYTLKHTTYKHTDTHTIHTQTHHLQTHRHTRAACAHMSSIQQIMTTNHDRLSSLLVFYWNGTFIFGWPLTLSDKVSPRKACIYCHRRQRRRRLQTTPNHC